MIIDIDLQPKQSTLWRLWDTEKHTRLGFGGSRGGSKSGGGRRCMLLRRLQYPNTTGLIIRRTYPELYKSHIVKLFEEYPEIRPMWREQSKELQLPNGSRLFFGSAEHAGDMASFYSAEFADIMVDEAQEFSQGELEGLTGSNRCTSNADITPAMLYTFMPGVSETGIPPVGLDYLKRVLVDGELRGQELRHRWAFVQTFAWDNIEWARKSLEVDSVTEGQFYAWNEDTRRAYFIERTEFGAVLDGLTNQSLRDAWLHGKWNKFEGQYFTNFDYETHTVPADKISLVRWVRYWLSGDWGDYHPACIHLHAEDDQGTVTTLDELWGRHIGEVELGRKIGQLCISKEIQAFPFSWDAFGRLNKETQKPITELIYSGMPQSMPRPTPADASPGSRISGWRHMSHMLDSGKWKISRKCAKLIECLPTLVRDMERNTEDVLKMDWSENYVGDDPADSARYGLQYMVNAPQIPIEVRVRARLEHIPDMSQKMLQIQSVLKDERKKGPQSIKLRRPSRWAQSIS